MPPSRKQEPGNLFVFVDMRMIPSLYITSRYSTYSDKRWCSIIRDRLVRQIQYFFFLFFFFPLRVEYVNDGTRACVPPAHRIKKAPKIWVQVQLAGVAASKTQACFGSLTN